MFLGVRNEDHDRIPLKLTYDKILEGLDHFGGIYGNFNFDFVLV